MAGKKCRCWWYVQLVENLPVNWRDQLRELMIPGAFVVHDRDVELTEDGIERPKRPHVHFMLEFGSPVLVKTALEVVPESFGILFAKPVGNKVGAYRYLAHLGQEDKAQYDFDEVEDMAGFKVNISDVCNVDFCDVYDLINEMKITNFAMLMSFLVEFKPEYVPYVSSHVNLVKTYITELNRCCL